MAKNETILCLDLDGTLLNKDSKITLESENYLKSLKSKGYRIVISTGRPVRNAINFYKQLDLDTPMICYNGSKVIHPLDNNFKTKELIFPQKDIIDILDMIPSKDVEIALAETDECVWISHEDEQIRKDFWYHHVPIIYGDFHQTLKEDTITFLLRCVSIDATLKVKELIESHYKNYKVRVWQGYLERFCEIYIDGTSKASGMDYVCDYLDIPVTNSIAFGDSENDIEMVKHAHIGYAMKNSDQSLLDHATLITEYSNDENGVIKELQKIIK